MKRYFSLILIIVVVLSCFPASIASAAENTIQDMSISYEIFEGYDYSNDESKAPIGETYSVNQKFLAITFSLIDEDDLADDYAVKGLSIKLKTNSTELIPYAANEYCRFIAPTGWELKCKNNGDLNVYWLRSVSTTPIFAKKSGSLSLRVIYKIVNGATSATLNFRDFAINDIYNSSSYEFTINGTTYYDCEDVGNVSVDLRTPDLSFYGAQIRKSTSNSGLRFIAQLKETSFFGSECKTATYSYASSSVKFGTLISFTDAYYGDTDSKRVSYIDFSDTSGHCYLSDLDVGSVYTKLNIVAEKIYNQSSDIMQYTGVVTGIPETYMLTEDEKANPNIDTVKPATPDEAQKYSAVAYATYTKNHFSYTYYTAPLERSWRQTDKNT